MFETTRDNLLTQLSVFETLSIAKVFWQKLFELEFPWTGAIQTQSSKFFQNSHVNLTLFCKQEVNEAWERLKRVSLLRQQKLAGAHEIQAFYR